MSRPVIHDAAVVAAARTFYGTAWDDVPTEDLKYALDQMRETLEAAYPIMLSHEREETRLAHLDAVVNARTVDKLNTAIEAVLALTCKPDANKVPRNQPDLVPPFYSDRIRAAITKALQ